MYAVELYICKFVLVRILYPFKSAECVRTNVCMCVYAKCVDMRVPVTRFRLRWNRCDFVQIESHIPWKLHFLICKCLRDESNHTRNGDNVSTKTRGLFYSQTLCNMQWYLECIIKLQYFNHNSELYRRAPSFLCPG